ncbi:L-asparaginase, putative [Perkinsus marinus ATCC 50983]|uniref:asparaginase n=1 Tax=Perkinsus marinus (strain ATCC 50983 / TXsc) TaxID=423536 RepID=C5LBH1_PERM5|nr:L-asparaginase, putative [Perkinsus marinus ATCC 50983]EER05792.1 L-asparaginase, putative [Perkinsus marinus ATCC 50983]|eukprot:XP_002773976.1 L-asparaginase, putative [Perkinsus marinus ATCC 50983]
MLFFPTFITVMLSYASAEFCRQLCDFYPACRFSKYSSHQKENGACFGFYHKDKGFCFQPTEQATCDDSKLRPVFAPNVRHEPGKVLIIYTGGTIGMQPFANGTLHPVPGYLTRQIHSLPELQATGMPSVSVIEWDNLIDSSDMSPEGWAAMAKAVEDNYDDYDGFVILHGTDTMSYTSSALSFMFSNLAKSVIITGSILPFDEPHSDARRNIIVSVLLAGLYNVPEVSIFFGTHLLRGSRSVKVDSGAIEAFDSPKFPALATMNVGVNFLDTSLVAPTGPLEVQKEMEGSLLVLRMSPGFASLESLDLNDVKGVVLLLYGTGNAPSNQPHFTNWLLKLKEQGIPVIAVSQVVRGTVALADYAAGAQLLSLDLISAGDMTAEAATTKLSYLLGKGYTQEEIAKAFGKSMRGELTENNIAADDPFRDLSFDVSE